MQRLRRALRPAATALVIAVPEAQQAVRTAGDASGEAHVTVLWPFLRRPRRRDVAALRELLSGVSGFDARLTGVEQFPDVVYLAVEPAEPFVALTERVAARWPRHRPYAGAFDQVIPHLTLCAAEQADPDRLRRVEQLLPIAFRVTELQLVRPDPGAWRRLARLPLRPASST